MIIPIICGAVAVGAAVYAGSNKWLKVEDVRIESEKIVPGRQVSLLHISDLHCRSFSKCIPDIFGRLDKLRFDFAVITGDLVLGHTEELEPHLSALEKLAAGHRVYYVDGNHEKYIYDEIKKTLEELGVIVLNNETVGTEFNGNRINIVGVRDLYWLKKNMVNGSMPLPSYGNDAFNLMLSHQPQIVEYIGYTDLILCGHTHGGQVRLPFMPALYAPGQGLLPKYDHGLYETSSGRMYISKGIGATNFNFRFYNRPELAIIHLEHPRRES